jgi:hypothetical protein
MQFELSIFGFGKSMGIGMCEEKELGSELKNVVDSCCYAGMIWI